MGCLFSKNDNIVTYEDVRNKESYKKFIDYDSSHNYNTKNFESIFL